LLYAIIDHKWRAKHQVPGSFSRLCVDGLESMKHPFTQQRKASPAIALPFDQFELVYVAFHHTITDPPGETRPHRIFVFPYPSGKGLQFRKFAALYPSKPGVETLSSTCAQYQSKLLNEIISPIDPEVDLTKLNQHLLFLDA